jgi:hypothetical protein
VKPCPKSSEEDQRVCKLALEEARRKRQKKNEEITNLRNNVDMGNSELESEQAKQTPLNYGAFGKYVEINPVDPTKFTRQQNVTNMLDKKRVHDMQMYIARWIYEAGIPFNAINRDSFIQMLEAIGQFGPGAPPPTLYQLREPYLIVEGGGTAKHWLIPGFDENYDDTRDIDEEEFESGDSEIQVGDDEFDFEVDEVRVSSSIASTTTILEDEHDF